jgi:hypothetical protein
MNKMERDEDIVFSILDPTGNITALVESRIPIDRQLSVAAGIMALYEDVEQVGFVSFDKAPEAVVSRSRGILPDAADNVADSNHQDSGNVDCKKEQSSERNSGYRGGQKEQGSYKDSGNRDSSHVDCELRMAGGEFCGNAAMSAAVLFYVRTLMNQGDDGRRLIPAEAGPAAVGEVCMAEAGRAAVAEGCMAEADSCARKTDGSESVEGYRAREAGLSVTEAGHPSQETGETDQEAGSYVRVMLKVSGASEPSEVRIYDDLSDAKDNRKGTEAGSLQKTAALKTQYLTSIRMPAAAAIHEETFSLSLPQGGSLTASLPVVDMEGISHIIVEEGSPFYSLCQDDEAAKKAIRSWQKQLGADGLGLMFLEDHPSGMKLTPLVYIPGGDTMFWERSCASGSSAVGMYYAWRKGTPVELSLHEPGGCLKVASNPLNRETWLKGRVSIKADARTC